jgi:small-conductance mechanosensitive channel
MNYPALIQTILSHKWVTAVLILAGALAAGFIIHLILTFILNRRFIRKNTRIQGIELSFEQLKAPLRSLIPAVCIGIALPFTSLNANAADLINHIIRLWVIASLTWLAIRIVYMARDVVLSHYRMDVKDNLHARKMYTQIRVIDRVISVIILIIGISIMLMTFSKVKQVGVSLLASAGVIGIILGFAAQKTLGNLISGIQIAIAQPIRLEDVVIVENEWGWIEEITLTYVVVRIWDLRRLIVPISYFTENPIQNWTRKSADLLGSVFIYADYTIPVEEVRNELTRILEQSSSWDKKVNVLQVTNATERTVELRALMSASDSPTAWNLRCEVREKLLNFLQQNHPECLPKVRLELEKDNEGLPGNNPEINKSHNQQS